ncbi:ER-derived vesicles protein ERV14 [Neoconidiobolus thromboides FSU 785]|nr:ER-derived vesicles protein ERV14 [Neoconidiobolus thromboides FSU 785]
MLGFLYLCMLVIDIALFVNVLFMLMYITDVESDYINPIDCCRDLNKYVKPELVMHFILSLLSLFTGHWLTVLFIFPILGYNIYRLINNKQIYDATNIYRELNQHKIEYFSKLAFYMLSLFYYLFRTIVAFMD